VDYKIYYDKSRRENPFKMIEEFHLGTIFQKSIDVSIVKEFLNKDVKLGISAKNFPIRGFGNQASSDESSNSIKYSIGGSFMVYIFMCINWVIFLYKIQFEKEKMLRFASNLMGMKSFSYWFAMLSFHFLINFVSFILAYILGLITSIPLFFNVNPVITIFLFTTIIILSLISSIFISVMIQSLRLSVFFAIVWNFVSLVVYYMGYIPRNEILENLTFISPTYHIGRIVQSIITSHFSLGGGPISNSFPIHFRILWF
jgi:hypothetical protein